MVDDFLPPKAPPKPTEIEPTETAVNSDVESFDTPAPQPTENTTQIDDTDNDSELASIAEDSSFPAKTPKHKRFHISWPPTKKQLLIGSATLVVFVMAGITAYVMTHRSVATVANHIVVHKKAAPAAPKTVPSTLTGLPVDPSVNQRPVTGVMIENSTDARPQSGLDQAGVVFEAVAEGGVTRFLALFQDTQPDYIGPVRSARPYYIQWCEGFDCSYAHVGGSPDGLALIKTLGVKDLDQFYNSGAYERISTRYAPHNVYTSIAQLNQLESSKGYGTSTYSGFARKADKPYKAPVAATAGKPAPKNQDTRTPATSIDFVLSGSVYNPHFDYDAATNSYKRSEGGAPHMELLKNGSQVQITPKVVISIVVPESQGALDSSGAYYSNYQPIGSGQAFIFQDGTVQQATWSKPDVKSQISFTDASGKPVALDAGQTWITAITSAGKATYK